MNLADAIAEALKERSEPDRQFWFNLGKRIETELKHPTPRGIREAMYWANEEADLAVGLLDQLGNSPARVALGALREGIKSRIYTHYIESMKPIHPQETP